MSTTYGDISPRTAAAVSDALLARAAPSMCMARFGQQKPIPRNKTTAIRFRRYNAFAPSLVPLVEGVTPAPDVMTFTDVQATLQQFGRRVQISDVIADTHEDPVLMEMTEAMGEVAAQTQELVIYNALRGGTNVIYSGGTTRATVNASMAGASGAAALNRLIRQLNRQNAQKITSMVQGSDKVGTVPIRPAWVVFCHPDLQIDLESIPGWRALAEYGSYQPLMPNEMGSFKDLRFLASTLYSPFLATGASGSTLLTNGLGGGATGNADVYPLIAVGKDAFATVTLAGANAVSPTVVNPKPSDSDPLGQRGHVGFKMWGTACILNDAWMVRVECGVAQ